jgi:ATP-dependent Clp protease protease subunit
MEKKPEVNQSDETITSVQEIIGLTLLGNHTHMITGDIDEESVDKTIRWLLYENTEDPKTDKMLTLYINSTGGSLIDAFALIDIMRNSRFPIRTIGIGNVMSAAFLIFTSGQKGHRYIAKNSSSMCHQFTDSMYSKYHDIKAAMKENDNINERMINLLVESTGQLRAKIKSKLLGPSDMYLSAEEMVENGVADHIL